MMATEQHTSGNTYPVFLQVSRMRCLVVGGGRVAQRKVSGLLAAGATPEIVAPELTAALHDLAGKHRLRWIARKYSPGDTHGFQLVIAATDDRQVNAAICREAQAANLLCNDVTDPANGNVHVAATVRRPPLEIAIGTGGELPFLSHKLREHLEQTVSRDLDAIFAAMRMCRARLLETPADDAVRAEIKQEMDRLADRFIALSKL